MLCIIYNEGKSGSSRTMLDMSIVVYIIRLQCSHMGRYNDSFFDDCYFCFHTRWCTWWVLLCTCIYIFYIIQYNFSKTQCLIFYQIRIWCSFTLLKWMKTDDTHQVVKCVFSHDLRWAVIYSHTTVRAIPQTNWINWSFHDYFLFY